PNQPVPVEKQVAIIYIAGQGYLDGVPVSAIQKFEKEFYTFLDTEKPDILESIRREKALTDDIKAKLDAAVKEFKQKVAF
ncbi:MAG: F0F1 ATP synthase subunit alpha, partial [Hydrogenothermaceae bacterium]